MAKRCKGGAKRDIPHHQSPSKVSEISIIPESDLYRLIMRSNMPDAERFQDWVVVEILPSIRKTGTYSLPKPKKEVPKIDRKAREVASVTASMTKIAKLFGFTGNQLTVSVNSVIGNPTGWQETFAISWGLGTTEMLWNG